MTLYTVTITGVSSPVEVYAGLTAAKDYVGAMLGDGADAWALLSDDSKSKVLVQATRYVDRQSWAGTSNATGGTTLQWPRDGVTEPDGTAVDSTTVPSAVLLAIGELCALIAADSDVVSAADTSTNIKGVGAGPARVDFFNPTTVAAGTATHLPTVVQQLVGKYLGSATAVADDLSQGGKCDTDFGRCDDESIRRFPW